MNLVMHFVCIAMHFATYVVRYLIMRTVRYIMMCMVMYMLRQEICMALHIYINITMLLMV